MPSSFSYAKPTAGFDLLPSVKRELKMPLLMLRYILNKGNGLLGHQDGEMTGRVNTCGT